MDSRKRVRELSQNVPPGQDTVLLDLTATAVIKAPKAAEWIGLLLGNFTYVSKEGRFIVMVN